MLSECSPVEPTLTNRHHNVAELKLRIIRQQERAAKLCKSGQHQKARAARGRLLVMLNQLDVLEHIGDPGAAQSNGAYVVPSASVDDETRRRELRLDLDRLSGPSIQRENHL